ncbi:alpha/beta hydrolase [Lampropedia cohaerens]|uniref:alpha/beta hydrolase n=1 Tax=Lampropedia cohaerens TaxID=1610491 RepID=UPI0006998D8B|nr:alpha/beta hydrolase-fold protein [Lampropedia cohaerens]
MTNLPTPFLPLPATRRTVLRAGASGVLATVLAGCAHTRTPSMPVDIADLPMQPTRLPRSSWLDWQDRQSGHQWRIWLQMPELPAPPEGYPALLVMDGNAIFPLAAQWSRLQQTRPAYVRGEPCVIIGIGHPGDALFDSAARNRDYTPAAPGVVPSQGGADILLDFLEHTLLAGWTPRLPLDPRRIGLFGHSLSGLFVLHALFTRPHLFTDYYAASPSIWWHDAYLLQEQQAFSASQARFYQAPAPARGQAPSADPNQRHANVFLYAGSLEEPTGEARPANAPPTGQRHTVRLQITRAREMAEQLTALQWPGLKAQFHLWPDLTHGDTMMPSLMQAVGNMSMPPHWKDADFGLRDPSAGK